MVILRTPSTHPQSSESSASSSATPHPKISWLQGTWHVTHSTLPMWKSSRNVRITYTLVPNTSPPHLDDLVSYQKLKSKALKTVHGVDKPFDTDATVKKDADAKVVADTTTTDDTASLGYNWRGKGWLAIASSKWEILGYGDEEDTDNQWVVTYFAKTLFTPAGIDLYSRKGGLKPDTVESIKAGLAGLGGDLPKLATSIFEITVDGARDD